MWVDAEHGVLFSHAEVKALSGRVVDAVGSTLGWEPEGSGGLGDVPASSRRRLELAVSEVLHRAPGLVSGRVEFEPAFMLVASEPDAASLLAQLHGARRAAGLDAGAIDEAVAQFRAYQRRT